MAHQRTPNAAFADGQKQDYAEPNMFTVAGGAMFSNKADCVLAVWRPHKNTNQMSTEVKFISQKIKGQKYIGYPGAVDMDFVRMNGRYIINGHSPFEDIHTQPMPELSIENGEITPNETFYNIPIGTDADDDFDELPF